MTIDEKLEKLTDNVQNMGQIMRQGFQTLTELHGETQKEMQELQKSMTKLSNSMSALADHMGDHETRLDNLEGK
jgi:prefoldin subunit 5